MCQSLSRVHLCNPMDCSPPDSSVQGILLARVLEWVAISFSRGYSQPRDWTHISCIAGGFFTVWATREAPSIFRYCKNSIVLGEETEAHWPPHPRSLFASPRSSAHPPALHPQQNELQLHIFCFSYQCLRSFIFVGRKVPTRWWHNYLVTPSGKIPTAGC